MKFHLRRAVTVLFVVALGATSVAHAALIDRGGGLIFDTDLNITWLADANYAQTSGFDADGLMDWTTAMTWAGGLTYGGYTGWRLPTTLQPDATCASQDAFYGSSGYNCTGSEMGHLFYTELGGVASQSINTTHNANYNLFQNVIYVGSYYWSSTEFTATHAQCFNFSAGNQAPNCLKDSGNPWAAWAVHSGDVGAAVVPVPAAAWLFGSGLVGLFGFARRSARPA